MGARDMKEERAADPGSFSSNAARPLSELDADVPEPDELPETLIEALGLESARRAYEREEHDRLSLLGNLRPLENDLDADPPFHWDIY